MSLLSREDPTGDRFRAIVTAESRGESISAEDHAFRGEYERRHADAGRDAALWSALGSMGDARPDERTDQDIVGSAMAALHDPRYAPAPPEAGTHPPEAAERPRQRGLVVVAFTTAALAAAAALVLLVLQPSGVFRGDDDAPGSMAPSTQERDGAVHEASERLHDTEPPAKRRRGRKRAAASATDVPAVPEEVVEEVPEEIIEVPLEPEVAVADPTPARPKKPVLPSEPDELLTHAQRLFADGKTSQAVRAYERLASRHGKSAAGKTALVSLGRIELGRGHAKKALGHFDAYLAASAGPLVEEARYGRVRALRKLGRLDAEARSIEAFLADYPGSMYAPRLKKRVAELGAP